MRNGSGKFSYLRTPMGAVKLANVIFGAISLTLVGISFVSVWTLAVFVGTVTVCLCLSILYIIFYLLATSSLVQCKANRVTSFLFHVLAGVALIVAGIELIGWSSYDSSCKQNCPKLYTIGIAKTLTFMNGTLYLIVGFLGIKDDDMLDSSDAEEDIPLLHSNDILTSVPGKFRSSSSQRIHLPSSMYYDPIGSVRGKAPFYDDARAHYYFSHQQRPTAEYSFNNSCASSVSGIQFTAQPQPGHERRPRTASVSSVRSNRSVNNATSNPPPPTTVSPDLDLILE